MKEALSWESEHWPLGLIRNREDALTYDEVTETSPFVEEGIFDSPFKGKSLMECHYILRGIREDFGTDTNCMFFMVIDEQAIQEHKAIIAGYVEKAPDPDPDLDEPGERMRWQREEYWFAKTKLVALSVPHGDWEEDK